MPRGEKLTAVDYVLGCEADRKAGLGGGRLPPELRRMYLALVDRLAVIEENRKCPSIIRLSGEVSSNLLHLLGEQKVRDLDPLLTDAAGLCFVPTVAGGRCDPARNTSAYAQRDGGGWLIHGKIWVNEFEEADGTFVFFRTTKENTATNLSIFAVDKENRVLVARLVPMLDGYVTHQLTSDNCRVDEAARIGGGDGAGFKRARSALKTTQFGNAAATLGIARRCYGIMVEYAKRRVSFGGALSDKQVVQSVVIRLVNRNPTEPMTMDACAEKHESRGGYARRSKHRQVDVHRNGRSGHRSRYSDPHGVGCTYDSPVDHWYDTSACRRSG